MQEIRQRSLSRQGGVFNAKLLKTLEQQHSSVERVMRAYKKRKGGA